MAMAKHPKLARVLEKILGEAPAMFQDMALIKPPRIGREKPWHQDHAYFDFPMGTRVVGVWIALDEATVENGCMRMLAGGHHDGPRLHFQRRDWADMRCGDEGRETTCRAAKTRRVGAVRRAPSPRHADEFFADAAPRGSISYAGASVRKTSKEDRMAIFGSEGKDVTC